MESVSVERLDHLGIVASVIKDLGLIEMIDARLLLHEQEEVSDLRQSRRLEKGGTAQSG
jgi:Domain of unknown function (DUF4277)